MHRSVDSELRIARSPARGYAIYTAIFLSTEATAQLLSIIFAVDTDTVDASDADSIRLQLMRTCTALVQGSTLKHWGRSCPIRALSPAVCCCKPGGTMGCCATKLCR